MRPLLSKIIDPSQAVFVPHRWITENVVLAQEVVHSFKQMKKKKGSVGFKLDFHKAYDCLEWDFIATVLKGFGFDQKVVQLIHQCISTVNFTPLLNGYKSASFTTFRGIRQRDPLSPYLFILCSELLDRLINREVVNGSIKGVTLAPNAPIISKLSYADDVILFCGARISEVARLMECVDKFCGWSGLIVNRDKFGIFTSKGVHPQFIRQIMSQWGFKLLPKDSKYLGLPLFLSANKSKDLAFIKEKLEARVCGWKGKCLSWMGRATLIKPVAQATPIYGMSAFKFLKKNYVLIWMLFVESFGGALRMRAINSIPLWRGQICASHCVKVGLALDSLKASMKR
jgi:hypothetical protein